MITTIIASQITLGTIRPNMSDDEKHTFHKQTYECKKLTFQITPSFPVKTSLVSHKDSDSAV